MAAAEPFPDTVVAMSRLKAKYRLATISNSEDDIICHAVEKMENPFEFVITADTTHTYKPNPALFELVMAKAGVSPAETIHVAQSQYVDLPTSVPMGMRTIWINRQGQSCFPRLLRRMPNCVAWQNSLTCSPQCRRLLVDHCSLCLHLSTKRDPQPKQFGRLFM